MQTNYEQLIENAKRALKRSNNDWAKKYWSTVVAQLVRRQEYQKVIH